MKKNNITYRQWLQNHRWIFKFETLFDHLIQRDSNAQAECSRLCRNRVNTKVNLKPNPNLMLS